MCIFSTANFLVAGFGCCTFQCGGDIEFYPADISWRTCWLLLSRAHRYLPSDMLLQSQCMVAWLVVVLFQNIAVKSKTVDSFALGPQDDSAECKGRWLPWFQVCFSSVCSYLAARWTRLATRRSEVNASPHALLFDTGDHLAVGSEEEGVQCYLILHARIRGGVSDANRLAA